MFEYKTITIAKSESDKPFEEILDNTLNEYGKNGWELVTLHPFAKKDGIDMFPDSGMTTVFVGVFKKNK